MPIATTPGNKIYQRNNLWHKFKKAIHSQMWTTGNAGARLNQLVDSAIILPEH
jgi:hypothetical protein